VLKSFGLPLRFADAIFETGAAGRAVRTLSGFGSFPERKVAVLSFVLVIYFPLPVRDRFTMVGLGYPRPGLELRLWESAVFEKINLFYCVRAIS
jgi:hypothetical protein